jgi:hypothetical protein
MSKFNLIPEVEADWTGILKLTERAVYVLVATNVALIVYIIATKN